MSDPRSASRLTLPIVGFAGVIAWWVGRSIDSAAGDRLSQVPTALLVAGVVMAVALTLVVELARSKAGDTWQPALRRSRTGATVSISLLAAVGLIPGRKYGDRCR